MPKIFKNMQTKEFFARTSSSGTLIFTGKGTWMPVNDYPKSGNSEISVEMFPTLYEGLHRWLEVME